MGLLYRLLNLFLPWESAESVYQIYEGFHYSILVGFYWFGIWAFYDGKEAYEKKVNLIKSRRGQKIDKVSDAPSQPNSTRSPERKPEDVFQCIPHLYIYLTLGPLLHTCGMFHGSF